MDKYIDLRSDTGTLPTRQMLESVLTAKLGDDVQKEDLSTIRLQEYMADLCGKEAALFVASGTMGNILCILSNTPSRQSEIIAEYNSHIVTSEAASYAHVANVGLRTVIGHYGEMPPECVEAAIRDPSNIHHPKTALICMENTHNAAGGTVVGLENMAQIRAVADKYNIPMHLDGARVFNAAVALDVKIKEITKYFDSVQICLSKGLSAPVGGVIVGSKSFIEYATRMRKMIGGGMRQCGVITEQAYIAATTMVDRLKEDHENARFLAQGICNISGLSLDIKTVQTNMVRFSVEKLSVTGGEFCKQLKENGVLAICFDKYCVRLVTHRHISRKDCEDSLKIISKTAKNSIK